MTAVDGFATQRTRYWAHSLRRCPRSRSKKIYLNILRRFPISHRRRRTQIVRITVPSTSRRCCWRWGRSDGANYRKRTTFYVEKRLNPERLWPVPCTKWRQFWAEKWRKSIWSTPWTFSWRISTTFDRALSKTFGRFVTKAFCAKMLCFQTVLEMFPECSWNVLWVFLKCSWMFLKCNGNSMFSDYFEKCWHFEAC